MLKEEKKSFPVVGRTGETKDEGSEGALPFLYLSLRALIYADGINY